MSKLKSNVELLLHKDDTLRQIEAYLSGLINNDDIKMKSCADKLCYWLKDYIKYLKYEKLFNPMKNMRYKRGQIVKVNLGYNIGSEFGGQHYAIVIDRNNAFKSSTITIIPLTSVKDKTDIKSLHKGSIFLGNELFNSLNIKFSTLCTELLSEQELLNESLIIEQKLIDTINTDISSSAISEDDALLMRDRLNILKKRVLANTKKLDTLNEIEKEISKMKIGSIALVSQIVTISKIRISSPLHTTDGLSGIKISSSNLDLIDQCLSDLFIMHKKESVDIVENSSII